MPAAYRRIYNTAGKKPYPLQERRILLPAVPKRPVRFQTRTLIRTEFIHKDPYWFTMHVRGIPRRPRVGEDPLEARAVPHGLIHGSILERIVWRYLVAVMHFVPDIDFYFQSSIDGGHQLVGGIVADFMFPFLKIILNPLGPTHDEYIRIRKDNEQNMTLEELGYTVYMMPQDLIKDEMRFDDYMQRIFGWVHSGGPDSDNQMDGANIPGFDFNRVEQGILGLRNIA